MGWYYLKETIIGDTEQIGPLQISDLIEVLAAKKKGPETLVCHAEYTYAKWVSVNSTPLWKKVLARKEEIIMVKTQRVMDARKKRVEQTKKRKVQAKANEEAILNEQSQIDQETKERAKERQQRLEKSAIEAKAKREVAEVTRIASNKMNIPGSDSDLSREIVALLRQKAEQNRKIIVNTEKTALYVGWLLGITVTWIALSILGAIIIMANSGY